MAAALRAVRASPARAGDALARVWAAGDAALPLQPAAPAAATDRLLSVLRPASLVEVDDDGHVTTTPLPDARPVDDDLALVIATSGSTGAPKGVLLPHAALEASVSASLARLGCGDGQDWALALPTHHVAGITVLLRARASGGRVHVTPTTAALATTTALHVSLVPTQLLRLLEAGVDVARFATILLGGAAVTTQLLERARRAGARVVTSYGMTETCGGCVYDGVPLDGVEVALDDEGRIGLRGPVLFRGYRDDPERTAVALDRDGWFTTGDHGRRADDGRLEVLGRIDAVAVTGGENVALVAVEERLRAHPAVREVAVVAHPDAHWGERVAAAVVPRDPTRPPSLQELRDHVRGALPASHAPRELLVASALPRDAMGKVTGASVAAAAGRREVR